MMGRYVSAILTGGAATFVVLFVMQLLITAPKSGLDEATVRHFVDFVRIEREESFQAKERLREKPPEPRVPPSQALQPRVDAASPVPMTVDVPTPEVDFELAVGGLGLAPSDGEYQPLVKVKPPYPIMAQSRGIEGYCIVECTVTALGTVTDAHVVKSEPGSIFDKASLEAVKKFKYVPRVVNGEAIAVRGVTYKFIFEIEDP